MTNAVFTVGHSTHSADRFLGLIREHQITAVCDVRSRPYSRMNPQFNRETLKGTLRAHRVAYVFLGAELGARSDDPSCYAHGKVQYERLACTALFQQGLTRVQEGMKSHCIALMCAEREPLECHRTILIARCLTRLGVDVAHIHADGRAEAHADALSRLVSMLKLRDHDLFRSREDMLAEAYRLQADRIAYSGPAPGSTAAGIRSRRNSG